MVDLRPIALLIARTTTLFWVYGRLLTHRKSPDLSAFLRYSLTHSKGPDFSEPLTFLTLGSSSYQLCLSNWNIIKLDWLTYVQLLWPIIPCPLRIQRPSVISLIYRYLSHNFVSVNYTVPSIFIKFLPHMIPFWYKVSRPSSWSFVLSLILVHFYPTHTH